MTRLTGSGGSSLKTACTRERAYGAQDILRRARVHTRETAYNRIEYAHGSGRTEKKGSKDDV